MFRGRETHYAEQMSAELEPYRSLAVDYEVNERFHEVGTDLALAERHLLNSNDRYQMSAAYLAAAQTRYAAANTLTTTVVSCSEEVLRPLGEHGRAVLANGLQGIFLKSREYLETADDIYRTQGYKAIDRHISELRVPFSLPGWPGRQPSTVRQGFIEAVDATALPVLSQYNVLRTAPHIAPAYVAHFESKVHSLLTTIDVNRKGVDRMLAPTTPTPLSELEHETNLKLQTILDSISKLAIFLTYPQMMDNSLRVRNPLHENRPGERAFNAEGLGVDTGCPTDLSPPSPFQNFDSRESDQGNATAQPRPSRPFDPSTLVSPRTNQPFNPGKLGTSDKEE